MHKAREDHAQKIHQATSTAATAARALSGCGDVTVEVIEVAEAIDDISVNTIVEQIDQ